MAMSGHRSSDGSPKVEVLPANEQRRAPAGSRVQPGQRLLPAGYAKHWRPASLQRIVDRLPAEWVDCDRLARQAALARVAEWTSMFGGLSTGVCRLLMRAAEADADAQYFRVLGEQRDSDTLRSQADRRLVSARQSELMAWELATRECDRRRADLRGQAEGLDADLTAGLSDQSAVNGRSQSAGRTGGSRASAAPALAPPGGLDAGAPSNPAAPVRSSKPGGQRARPRPKKHPPAPERHAEELSDLTPSPGPSGPETPGEPE